ncbi:RNA-binding protein 43 [Anableps anableps]
MTTVMAENSRTVVVSGVPKELELSRMVDKLIIHFQSRRRSHGGDVKDVKYPTNMDGVAFVTFYYAADAERVVRKEQHTMMDEEFTQDYVLTVFPFSTDVFLYVARATVDLSVFGSDQTSLIKSLQSVHRSIRFQASPLQRKASVEGPFSAIRALREDLVRRASSLRPSSQTAGVKPRSSSPYPGLAPEKSLTSCRGTKAKREAAISSILSKSPQSTAEAKGVQSLISKDKTPKASLRQNVSNESLAGGSFRRVDGEEVRTRFVSSSGLTWLPLEETFTKQQRDDGRSQQPSRSDNIPAAQSTANYWKDSGSPMRDRKFPQSDLRKGSVLSTRNAEASEAILVDLYTFKYVEKFHKMELNRCLKGVNISPQKIEGNAVMQILLTEKQPSGASSRRLKDVLKNLETCMEFWQSELRVHKVFYNKDKLSDKQKLIQICNKVTSIYSCVMYVLEDSCIKVIGPSVISHLFCQELKACIERYTTVNPVIRKIWR